MSIIVQSNTTKFAAALLAALFVVALPVFASRAQAYGWGDYSNNNYGSYGYGNGYSGYGTDYSGYGYGNQQSYYPRDSYSPYNPSDYASQYSPSSYDSQYSPSDYSTQYSPSSYYSQYSPSSSNTDYSPASSYSEYAPSSYYSNYSPVDYHITINKPTQYVPVPVATPAPAPVVETRYISVAQSTPYVTLTQVPYTGLDLGPVGLTFYWGFLILWCLFMAYLITVKRVHYRLADSLKGFLFGADEEEEEEDRVETMPARASTPTPAKANTSPMLIPTYVAASGRGDDPVDEFILSQIHKVA